MISEIEQEDHRARDITDESIFDTLEHSVLNDLQKTVGGYIETVPYFETYEGQHASRSATKEAGCTALRSINWRLCSGTGSFAPINVIVSSLSDLLQYSQETKTSCKTCEPTGGGLQRRGK